MSVNFYWELLLIWCLLMTLDIASGYIKACKQYTVASGLMRAGIYRKVLDTFSILAVLLMQSVVSYLGVSAPIGPVLVGAFCFKELTSILENAAGDKETMPSMLRKWLEQIKQIFS